MIELSSCAMLVLAAGRAARFGDGDKLLADFGGRRLAEHAAAVAPALNITPRIAVVPERAPALSEIFERSGYDLLPISDGDRASGMGASLAAGAREIMARQALPDDFSSQDFANHRGVDTAQTGAIRGVIVMLADMPFVTTGVIEKLARSIGGADMVFARVEPDGDKNGDVAEPVTTTGARSVIGPPAIFRADMLPALAVLAGDAGARQLRGDGAAIDRATAFANFEQTILTDIDTRSDLDHWSKHVSVQGGRQ